MQISYLEVGTCTNTSHLHNVISTFCDCTHKLKMEFWNAIFGGSAYFTFFFFWKVIGIYFLKVQWKCTGDELMHSRKIMQVSEKCSCLSKIEFLPFFHARMVFNLLRLLWPPCRLSKVAIFWSVLMNFLQKELTRSSSGTQWSEEHVFEQTLEIIEG